MELKVFKYVVVHINPHTGEQITWRFESGETLSRVIEALQGQGAGVGYWSINQWDRVKDMDFDKYLKPVKPIEPPEIKQPEQPEPKPEPEPLKMEALECLKQSRLTPSWAK